MGGGGRRRGIQIVKEEVKLYLLTDDIILYVENPTDSNKKITRANEWIQ